MVVFITFGRPLRYSEPCAISKAPQSPHCGAFGMCAPARALSLGGDRFRGSWKPLPFFPCHFERSEAYPRPFCRCFVAGAPQHDTLPPLSVCEPPYTEPYVWGCERTGSASPSPTRLRKERGNPVFAGQADSLITRGLNCIANR